MHAGEREALFVVATALGEACRMLKTAGNVDSPWHRRFTSTRHCLLGMLGGWEPAVSRVDDEDDELPGLPLVARRLRAVP